MVWVVHYSLSHNDFAGQTWDVIKKVGKHHSFSGGAIVKCTGI